MALPPSAPRACARFSNEEISDLLGQDFMAMLARVKSGGLNQPTPYPMPKL